MARFVMFDARDPRIEHIWRSLEAEASPSYVLSWGWIENWLACLADDEVPPLAVIHDDVDRPIAVAFLGRPRRMPPGLLRAPRRAPLGELVAALPPRWNELYLPAVDRDVLAELGAPAGRGAYRVQLERDALSPFVDLDTVRAAGAFDAVVAPTARALLRRAHHQLGPLSIEVAGDEDHALDIYGELLRLHARESYLRRARGAFADPWLDRFHRRLIARRLRHGEIQLVRVRAGGATIGCLYNLSHGGRVNCFQRGLDELADPRLDAGALCDEAAIELAAADGLRAYELRADGHPTTPGLATGATRRVWVRVQRRGGRFAIEDRLRAIGDAIASLQRRVSLASGRA